MNEDIYEKVWDLIVAKLGDNTDSDSLTDQVIDVINKVIDRYEQEIYERDQRINELRQEIDSLIYE